MFLRISTGGEAKNTTYGMNSEVLIVFSAYNLMENKTYTEYFYIRPAYANMVQKY